MPTKFGLLIDFDLQKAAISTSVKPEIVFSVRGRHLDKAILRYISAVAAPILTKFGRLMQNKMQITGKWSISEPEVDFQYGGHLFFPNQKSLYLSRKLIYVDHWCRWNLFFYDRFWPSKFNDINKHETGSSIERPRPPSWKIDMTSYFARS